MHPTCTTCTQKRNLEWVDIQDVQHLQLCRHKVPLPSLWPLRAFRRGIIGSSDARGWHGVIHLLNEGVEASAAIPQLYCHSKSSIALKQTQHSHHPNAYLQGKGKFSRDRKIPTGVSGSCDKSLTNSLLISQQAQDLQTASGARI